MGALIQEFRADCRKSNWIPALGGMAIIGVPPQYINNAVYCANGLA
jgi:hypothetical protein